ncbi:glycoside hydrolase family 18 protein [Mycena vitilis]|nr:glycoside hydrolase family 18 protein [Mycena vitilis]
MYRSLGLLSFLLSTQSLSLVHATKHAHASPNDISLLDIVPRVSNTSSRSEVVAAAWYPSWSSVRPADLSWHQYTHMVYSFGLTTPDPGQISGLDENLLRNFVHTAKSKGVTPMLSIGGWTGSQYFSTAVATSEHRTKFLNAIVALVNKYQLDGIDFDWEYPGHQGLSSNVVSPHDSANFLLFLQQLRKKKPTLELTAAVYTPFTGSDGNPMPDVSGFAKVLDRVELMIYDTWSSKTHAGPNAPLRDNCAPPDFQFGSVESVVAQWTKAKFPAEKIVLGLAAYGHSFCIKPTIAINEKTCSLNMYPAISNAPCGTPADDGIFNFEDLVNKGFLDSHGNANVNYAIDECSGTPFAYDEGTHVMVSYDDARSFGLKGKFINDNDLGGFAVWDATGDYKDILSNSLHSAMGIQDCE